MHIVEKWAAMQGFEQGVSVLVFVVLGADGMFEPLSCHDDTLHLYFSLSTVGL